MRILDEIVTTRFVTDDGRDIQIFVNFNRRCVTFGLRGKIEGRLYLSPEDEGADVSLENPEFDLPAHSVAVIEYKRG